MLLQFFTLLSAVVEVTSQPSKTEHNPQAMRLIRRENISRTFFFEETFTPNLMRIFEGPLYGKSIALAFDATVDRLLSNTRLLSSIPTSFILIRESSQYYHNFHTANTQNNKINWNDACDPLKQGPNEEACVVDNLPGGITTAHAKSGVALNTTLLIDDDGEVPLRGTVLVYVTTGEETKFLLDPPSSWSLSALLIVFTSENCDKSLLQTKLADRTSSLAILCPGFINFSPKTKENLVFHVYTWQPFHPLQKLLYVGRLSPFSTGRLSSINTWNDLFVDRFPSFFGATLHLASDSTDVPYFYTNENGVIDGINKRMLDTIAKWLNINFKPSKLANEYNWGENINGTWNGFLGEIWNGTKDLTINSHFITYERGKAFDFTQPYSYEGYGFAVKIPSPLPRWRSITYPFSTTVWGTLVLTVFVILIIFYLIQVKKDRMSIMETVLLITKSLVNQGVDYKPETFVLRFFMVIWWFSAYVFAIVYGCNLISFFTVPVYPPKIKTLPQLAESTYRLCKLDYGDFITQELTKTSQPLLSELGRKLDLVPVDLEKPYLGMEACVERLLKTSNIHLDFFPFLESSLSQMGLSKKVYFVQEVIYKNNLVLFFKKHNAWKYKFDQAILQFLDTGLILKWKQDIMNELRKTSKVGKDEETDQLMAISINHLQGPFFILAFSIIFSIFTFCFEKIFL